MRKIFLISVCLHSFNLFSQTDTTHYIILPEMKIYQKENGKTVTYSFEKGFNKFSVSDSFLTADPKKYKYNVKIADIKKIEFRNGTNFWGGSAYGAALGFVIGFFAGGYFNPNNEGAPVKFHWQGALVGSFVVAVPFGLIGGLIGLLSPKYDSYKISNKFAENKKKYLMKIFKENNPKK